MRKRKQVGEQREVWDSEELADQFHSGDLIPRLEGIVNLAIIAELIALDSV